MIKTHIWNATDKSLQSISSDELCARRQELLGGGWYVWVDLEKPTVEEEELILRNFYSIHTLSLEDITRLRREPEAPPHLPKAEEFPDYLFVIVNPLTQEVHAHIGAENRDRPSLTQLSAILTENVLITHHYRPLACITAVEEFLTRHAKQIERGPDYLFHLILDHTVDEFVPALDAIDDSLQDLESTIIRHPDPTLYLRLLRLKRVIILLRKTLIAEREVLVRLARGEFALVNEREMVYYRNVYDHLVRFTELIESSREMVSDLMQTYLSAQANHLNQIMKVLTMISTIVLPMSLIAGIYGMNYRLHLPDQENPNGFFIAIGLMVLSAVVSLGLFWWRRWL